MPAPIARRLAAVLRQHAAELEALAGTLEETDLENNTDEQNTDGTVAA